MIKQIITCDRCKYSEDVKNSLGIGKIQSGFVIIKLRDTSDIIKAIFAEEKCLCKKCHKSFKAWMNPPLQA